MTGVDEVRERREAERARLDALDPDVLIRSHDTPSDLRALAYRLRDVERARARLEAFARDWVSRDLAEWERNRPRRCDLTNQAGSGRCKGEAVAVRWEDGFPDWVCEHHAGTAEGRGALVVRPSEMRP